MKESKLIKKFSNSKLGKSKFGKIIKEIISMIKNKDGNWIANSLAYSFIVSFIPVVFAAVVIAVRYFITAPQILDLLHRNNLNIPYVETIIHNVQNNLSGTGVFLTILLVLYSIYLASQGVRTLIDANVSFYPFKTRGIVFDYAISLLVVLILIVAIFIMIAMISVIPGILRFIGLGFLVKVTYILLLPVAFGVMFIISWLTCGFNLHPKFVWPGALVSSLIIFVIITFSSLIINAGAMSSAIFGSLITLLLFAHFLYYISFSIYAGMLVNVANYRVTERLRREDFAENMIQELEK